jgi:hypothetical protein
MEKRGGACGALVDRHGEKNTASDCRHGGEVDVKINLREIGWGLDWIDLALDRDRQLRMQL